MAFEVTDGDFEGLSDDSFSELLAAVNDLDRESHPRHTDLTDGEFRTFAESPGMTHHRFLAHEARGELAGFAAFRYPDDGTNSDTLICDIRVLPAHRRQSLGSSLLAKGVELATELDRSVLLGFVFDTVPAGGEFARRIGATEKLDFHENVVRVADLDRDLLRGWVDLGRDRAPGYSVRLIEGLWPEELFDDIAHLYYVLERDMPTSDNLEPRRWDADRVRDMQDHYSQEFDLLSAFAIEEATGRAVGMSDMVRRITDPTTWIVTTTMVDPEHRGRSLGKWVKGVINLAALERWPDGIYEETGNAFTNEPMLAINHAMGFEHELTITECTISTDEAMAYLEERGLA